MASPHIRTSLPGPKAQALLARDRAVSSPSYPRDYPFVMARGRGVEVWDVDGNRFLDFDCIHPDNAFMIRDKPRST